MDKINLLKDLQKLRSDIDTLFNSVLTMNNKNCIESDTSETVFDETSRGRSIDNFIDSERYSCGDRCRKKLSMFFKEYQRYCFKHKIFPSTITVFSRRLEELGFNLDGSYVNAKRI